MLDDPEVALMIARKTAEAVCKIMFCDKVSPNNIPTGLDALIQQLNKSADLPKKLNLHLLNIQQHGNFGSHDQGDESDEIDAKFVEHCITSLDFVCTWLLEKHLGAAYQPVSASTDTTLKPDPTTESDATGKERIIHLKPPFTVKQLADAIALKPFVVIKNLMDLGVYTNQNRYIDTKVAVKICEMHGWRFEREVQTKAKEPSKGTESSLRHLGI